ncbi:MAG: MATE family efflux transporter [Clostridia bacterium]|nr:MATE family efflux transporter [Clostridia bacterium]
MGTMPVNKLLITMALPMMISMLVQALYNIVDSIFVAQISENALTAVSLAFPVQNLMIAVATGTGVGVNALTAKSLGEKNFENANKYASNGVFLAFVSYALFLIVGIFFSRVFFEAQTDVKEIVEYGVNYLTICCVMSFGVFGQVIYERLMQATGKTVCSMLTQGLGAIVNIVLDPILIFGLLGLPKMGVAGAALATVIGQIAAMFFGMYLNKKKNTEITVNLKKYKPDFSYIKRIYSIGVPSIIMASIGSVMTFAMNKILITFTETAATVFGVYFKLQSFIFMPVFGLNNGLVPIFSYNYGAQNRTRMLKALKFAVIYATGFMLVGIFLMQVFPEFLLGFFNPSETMLRIGVPALRGISLSFIFAGACITIGSAFQALNHGFMSMFVSIGRQLVVLIPVAYLLSLTGNIDLVWLSFPIAELASTALTIIFFIKLYNSIIKHIPLKQE